MINEATKSLSTFFILVFSSCILLFNSSCLEVESENRTSADELEELEELLTSLEENGYDVDTTSLGVYYIVYTEGDGQVVSEGDTVSISYNGYYPDGTLFDSSDDWATDGIWEFVYGEQSLIEGFNNGLSIMSEGSEIGFIIPSDLGYGEYGYGEIGAYQTLVLSVVMHEIKYSSE